jgi:hypothetical protein
VLVFNLWISSFVASSHLGLERCGKSCRLRWINYLRPDLKRGAFSQEEEDLIIHLHSMLGNKCVPPTPSTHAFADYLC